uniref:Uncharacterized protein n=3 Tax=Triticum TaxID=4564 RepID=A0A8R7P7Z5_TRIUA
SPEPSRVVLICSREIRSTDRRRRRRSEGRSASGRRMADWAPVVVGVVLFILLSPGLLLEMPGSHRHVDFGGLHTNGKAIFVHTILFFAAFTILTLALHIHIYAG